MLKTSGLVGFFAALQKYAPVWRYQLSNWEQYPYCSCDKAIIYEEITARFELYTSLERGLKDIQEGNTRPLSVALSDLRWRRKK